MKNTSDALRFALQFFNQELPHDICNEVFNKAKGNIEQEFPLNYSCPEWKVDRDKAWQNIEEFVNNQNAVLLCKTALLIFSKFSFPYNALMQQQIQKQREQKKTPAQYDEQALTKEIVELRDFLKKMKFYYGKTSGMIENEIRYREGIKMMNKKLVEDYQTKHDIDGVIQLYRSFLKSTKTIDLNNTPPDIIGAFLSTVHNEQHFEIQLTKGQNPSDLPYRALIFIVFMVLWTYGKSMKKSARLTSSLINEYFCYTTLIGPTRTELSEDDILNQWKNSKYRGEFLRSKTPCDIL